MALNVLTVCDFPPCVSFNLHFASTKNSDGEQITVPYRYNVGALPSNKTNCFKPNPLASGFDHDQHKQWSLGPIYLGNMGKVFRQENNKNAAALWEAPGHLLKVPFLFNPCVVVPPTDLQATTVQPIRCELCAFQVVFVWSVQEVSLRCSLLEEL